MDDQQTVISQTKLFVGGLDWSVRWQDLREEFAKFGEVVFARVTLFEDENGRKRSKGFGFVEFANSEDAQKAQSEMDGKEIVWRAVKVDFAKENPNRIQARTNEYTRTSENIPAPENTESNED